MELPNISILAGNANPELAQRIARHLKQPLGRVQVGKFSDGEVLVEVYENVRGRDVFLVQSTCPPVNDNLIELLVLADACRRASAASITAVIPYFGYARQDRRPRAARVPITASMVARMISESGIKHVLTVDLHADQIQGFFSIPVDNVYSSPVLLGDLWRCKYEEMVIVSPDVGGVVRARAIAKRMDDADLAIIDKRRPRANVSEVMNIIGEVEGKVCVLIDDMVDTAGTLCHAAIGTQGSWRQPRGGLCHTCRPFRSRPSNGLPRSGLDELVVTDTIPLSAPAIATGRIRQLSVAELLGETMRRISQAESVSSMYLD